ELHPSPATRLAGPEGGSEAGSGRRYLYLSVSRMARIIARVSGVAELHRASLSRKRGWRSIQAILTNRARGRCIAAPHIARSHAGSGTSSPGLAMTPAYGSRLAYQGLSGACSITAVLKALQAFLDREESVARYLPGHVSPGPCQAVLTDDDVHTLFLAPALFEV